MTADLVTAVHDGARWLSTLTQRSSHNEESAFLTVFGLVIASRLDAESGTDAERLVGTLTTPPRSEGAGRAFMALAAVQSLPQESILRAVFAPIAAGVAAPTEPLWLPLLDDETLPYLAPADLIRAIANDVAIATLFGTRELPFPYARPLRELLSFWAFCCIREEDLDLLCPVVRASFFLGRDEPDAIAFILDRQRADGRFSAQELSIGHYAAAHPDFDVTHDAYLPLTVASLWTLTTLR